MQLFSYPDQNAFETYIKIRRKPNKNLYGPYRAT